LSPLIPELEESLLLTGGCQIFHRIHFCLKLFLSILVEDLKQRSPLARLPVATSLQNRTIIDYIEKHYTEKINLRDFGQLQPYTLRHLSRMFKDELKISIFEYLKIYRILQASIRLETTDETITEIAYGCGYNSISCFFKDFSQIFSVTPRQFRLRHETTNYLKG
jgi:AraC-like DNA-binding protein